MVDPELRDLRLFLVLAEELHFGRTAERLGLTTSRVSQTVRALERKLGGQRLFDRTSRAVALTEAGRALRHELEPAVISLDGIVLKARNRSTGLGVLRLGVLNAASGAATLNRAIKRFEADHQGASVRISTTPFDDRLGPLRRGEVDLMVTRLPLSQPDIVVGPLLSTDDPRVIMVATDHPLAGRTEAFVEDLADFPVRRSPDDPAEVAAASCPWTTPSGRPIVAADIAIADVSELLLLIAQGRLVHPTVRPFADHFRHPDITVVPLVDLPPSSSALCWLRRVNHAGRSAFLAAVQKESIPELHQLPAAKCGTRVHVHVDVLSPLRRLRVPRFGEPAQGFECKPRPSNFKASQLNVNDASSLTPATSASPHLRPGRLSQVLNGCARVWRSARGAPPDDPGVGRAAASGHPAGQAGVEEMTMERSCGVLRGRRTPRDRIVGLITGWMSRRVFWPPVSRVVLCTPIPWRSSCRAGSSAPSSPASERPRRSLAQGPATPACDRARGRKCVRHPPGWRRSHSPNN